MHTFNHNPDLMLQLAASSRADQIERAARRRERRSARRPLAALGGYWGGLRHHPRRELSSVVRPT
ncbi:MAG TPA: hypothetical protein VFL38_10095 [Humibacillus xanthopallidus]|nr:hypothetical protein [Humibacillus xanthopallidus]